MQKFKKNWDGRSVEDWGCYMSKEANSFVTAFRNMLKRELEPKGFKIVSIKPGHYELYGYIEKICLKSTLQISVLYQTT